MNTITTELAMSACWSRCKSLGLGGRGARSMERARDERTEEILTKQQPSSKARY